MRISSEVTRAVGLDPRIGPSFLHAGLGFGGFCLPKDLQAFVHLAERSGVDFTLLKEAEKINKRRIDHFIMKSSALALGRQGQDKLAFWVWPSSPTRTTFASRPQSS